MLRDARERYDVPVVEVIYPATRRAVAASRTGRIGVICTRATAESMAYEDAFAAAPHVELTTRACPRFVDFVEDGVTGGDELLAVAHEYLDPLTAAGVDTLILGCTHYPLLTGVISYVMGDGVTLVSSAEECAKDVYKMLVEHRPDAAGRRAGVPLRHHRRARGVRADRPPVPRRRADGGHPVRRRRWREAHDRRLLGVLPRPGLAGQLLPPRGRTTTTGRTWRILLDLGSGALGALHRYADPLSIDAVALSHLHADHCLDLCGFYVLRKYHPSGPQPRLPVYGPERHRRADGPRLRPARRRRAWARSSTSAPTTARSTIGPFTVEAVPVVHPVEAYGLRVTAGGVVRRLHRRHGAVRGAGPARGRASTCCWPRRRSATATRTRRRST